jgi:hypothetical protein
MVISDGMMIEARRPPSLEEVLKAHVFGKRQGTPEANTSMNRFIVMEECGWVTRCR